MKKTLYMTGIMISIWSLISCNKEIHIPAPYNDGMVQTEFSFTTHPVSYTMTKAESIGEDDNSTILSLDMYEFNKAGDMVIHKRWEDNSGIDLASISYTSYSPYNATKTWAFFANLDEDTAEYFAQLKADEFARIPEGMIPLQPGNFKLRSPLMGGTAKSDFKTDATMKVSLYRYITKIEIHRITADFNDKDYFNKDVEIKRIAIINAPNALRMLYTSVKGIVGTFQDVLNIGYTQFQPGFGNLYHYNTNVNNGMHNINMDGTFNPGDYGGKGKLNADFPYCFNYNMMLAKGIMNVDAPGDIGIATSHEFEESEGILCSSSNENISHSVAVNKVFYTYPWDKSGSMWCDYTGQSESQKMVLEVKIDGQLYFYIMSLEDLEAGMVYKVGNISLKSIGSEYSNFYEKKYSADVNPLVIEEWKTTDVDNVDVGYNDDKSGIY